MKKSLAPLFLVFLLCLGGCDVQQPPASLRWDYPTKPPAPTASPAPASPSPAPASACACTSPEERIQALVTTLYTGPDKQQRKYYHDWIYSDGPESEGKAIAARLNYNKSRFHKGDFADGALDSITRGFAEEDMYLELYLCPWNASISCTAPDCEQQEDGSWRFAAPVTATHQEGFAYEFTVTGTVSFSPEDKITDFQITDDGGLHSALAETNLLAALPAGGASTCT